MIDSNIYIAALLRDSTVRKTIVHFPGKLFIPEVAFIEIENHKEELIGKSNLSEEEFEIMNSILKQYLIILSNKKLVPFREKSKEIIGSIDEDDVPFIAASLFLESCPIWSDDKHLKLQNKIKVYTTSEILEEIESIIS